MAILSILNKKLKLYTITDAAIKIGVDPKTIKRWEEAGKVPRAKRDYRGWRVYTSADIDKLLSFRKRRI